MVSKKVNLPIVHRVMGSSGMSKKLDLNSAHGHQPHGIALVNSACINWGIQDPC